MEMIKLGKLSKTGIIGLIEDISLDRKARVFSLFRDRYSQKPGIGMGRDRIALTI
jgi:hypothetical protein